MEKGEKLKEFEGDQNPSPKAPPRCKKGRSKGNVRRGATARVAMTDKSVGVIEEKDVRRDDPIEYCLLMGVRRIF